MSDVGASRIQCFGEPGSTPCVSNLFDIGPLERDRRRGTASLAVKVPGPGSLLVRGKQIKRARVDPEAAGEVRLPIRSRRKARRGLNQQGEARVRASVTYAPMNGGPNTRLKRIELRKRR